MLSFGAKDSPIRSLFVLDMLDFKKSLAIDLAFMPECLSNDRLLGRMLSCI